LAVLLAKERSKQEVVNDLNGNLVNFFRCVRFHQEPLLVEIEFVLNSREEFHDFRSQPGLTDIQRAARWFFRNKNCFGGANMDSFGTSALSTHGSRSARMEAIRDLSLRLDRVVVENLDWQHCIRLYDRNTTFFFIDPPYTDCDARMYGSWTISDVQKLRDVLAQLKGKWVLTFNDSAAIRDVFRGCRIEAVERARGINNLQGAKRYTELIICP
jgi:DNA adenine methylase